MGSSSIKFPHQERTIFIPLSGDKDHSGNPTDFSVPFHEKEKKRADMSRGLRERGRHVASGVRVILAVPYAPPSISCFALATRSPGRLLKQDGDIAMFFSLGN